MHPEQSVIEAALARQEEKINAIYTSVEKTRKTFQVIMWITIATVLLPFILILFALPSIIGTLSSVSSLYGL